MGANANTTGGYLSPYSKCGTTDVVANYTANLQTDDVVFADASAIAVNGSLVVTIPTPTGGDPCAARRITVKRTDNMPNNGSALRTVRVNTVGGATLDGAPSNSITLSMSTAYGIISGESVTLVYQASTNSWRAI